MKAARLIVTGLLVVCGCSRGEKPKNLVLISIDTLRADAVREEITPNLVALASRGVSFVNAVSPVPLTLPAHTTMLTGRLPMSHGMRDNLSYELSDSETTLAEMLKARGYTTGAIVSSFVLDSRFNLDQGFTTYDDTFEEEHKIAFLSERKGDEATEHAIAWLEENASRDSGSPFFLFLHYYDPHDDYAPPEPFRAQFPDEPYLGEVAFTDDNVGRVLAELDELGIAEGTYVVVVGDHGEMLGEHGELTHGYFIYESALRVPMILTGPGLEPRVVTERVGLVDLLPMLAGLLGVGDDEERDGVDSLDAPTDARRELYFESVTPNRYYGLPELHAITVDRWKYIEAPRPELYDLEEDPGESTNVLESEARIAEGMRRRLEERLSSAAPEASRIALDEDARQRLSALGYLGGASSGDSSSEAATLEDPKDWVGFFTDHQKLERLVNTGEYDEARVLAKSLLERKPDFAAGHLQLARIATETGDLAEAEAQYRRALEIDDENPVVHYNLGDIYRARGDTERASAAFRAALDRDPTYEPAETALAGLRVLAAPPEERLRHFREEAARSPFSAEAHYRLGLALRDSGRAEEALVELERAVEIDPSLAPAHNDLGVALKGLGREDDALQHYRRAVELDPTLAAAHNNLGSLLGARGRLREALDHFRSAVAADPENAEAQNNLGVGLRMTGARDEAIPHFEAALAARSDWAAPLNELAWILATHPDPGKRAPADAVRMAERAVELTERRQPVYLDTLAAAYAASGQFERAVTTGEQAVAIASTRAPRLAAEMSTRVALYRQGRPFVEPEGMRAAPR